MLTARVRKPIFGQAEGQLVLLEMPQVRRDRSILISCAHVGVYQCFEGICSRADRSSCSIGAHP